MVNGAAGTPPYRIAFVVEQTLGHVTHGLNLQANVAEDSTVAATWLPIPFPAGNRPLPLVGANWSVQASRQARSALRRAGAPNAFDAIFMHTQVTALFAASLLRRGGVISLDATPRNFDTLGFAYGHRPGPPLLERLKFVLNRRAFHAARRLVTWCDWARASLINDYAVHPARVTTIPPGVNLDLWRTPARRRQSEGKLRLLFVGGDFRRKGGDILLDVFRRRLRDTWDLDIVTGSPVGSLPDGARVHLGLAPNSAPLRRLFAEADVFVLPTRADCLAMVLMEAMAASLPVVASRVGALDEAVDHGATGLLVPPNDGGALAAALRQLEADPALRWRMGSAGYARACERFDARRNLRRLVTLLGAVAGRQALFDV